MERKIKYNYEFKLRCVNEVINKHRSVNSVANENNFDESNLRKWVKFYQKYGKEGLLPRKNQIYSVKFKQNVLLKITNKSLSLRDACLEFNISSESVVIQWQKRYKDQGILGLKDQPKGRPKSMNFKRAKKKSNKPLTREEELLLEIESLRCENALLKKFNALVQAEEAKQNKKHKP
ncbi:transposase [Flavobacterium crocinum]|uniref:Transposase n=1 Tax=Flavobacterium crocinum TaxID=2183896 RepID=A0A2S1YPU1_9FLAO|nr:helix-turn-helix domain-containing protein [Flavobacterium crocinum]AWK06071.1 transposase [Flavobacterium crocinum]AWK06388.1 transposase [Flavobacterium crocinum]AWK06695.1 transposase [Flavobacterium crocinum]